MKRLSSRHIKLLSKEDGDAGFKAKTKKEKIRRLSVMVRGGKAGSKDENSETGCLGFDEEDEIHSKAPSPRNVCKRFKMPRKIFDDCGASVPRKLRSAMKKGNCESVSVPLPDSKKSNHTMNSGKICKSNMKHGDLDHYPTQSISGPITKDEEDVVETLYALAGMFTNNEPTEIKLDGESSEEKDSTMLDARETPATAVAVQASIVGSDKHCDSTIGNAAVGSSSKEEVPQETATVDSFSGRQCNMGLVSSANEVELQTSEQCKAKPVVDENSLCKSLMSETSCEPSLEIRGLEEPRHQKALFPEKKLEITLEPAKVAGSKQEEHQHTIKYESEKNEGPALLRCSSSTRLLGSEIHGPSQSSAAKIPAWLDSATGSARPGSFERKFSTENVSVVTVVDRRHPWSRCATHVYISHLIQYLRFPEAKESPQIQLNQFRPNEGLQQEFLNPSRLRNSFNGLVSSCTTCDYTTKGKPNEATLLRKRLRSDQHRASAEPGACTLRQQGYEFFPLSGGGGGSNSSSSSSRTESGLSPQFHAGAQLRSPTQHGTALIPLSLPPPCYTNKISPAPTQQGQQQPSFYGGGPFCTTPSASTDQLQRQIWAAQLASQYRAGGGISNWQNGRRDSSVVQCARALGPKYVPARTISPPPQLFGSTSPFPPTKVKRQQQPHRSLPSSPFRLYEENGVGFYSDGALSHCSYSAVSISLGRMRRRRRV